MPNYLLISILAASSIAFAQTNTEKYNGYGVPNTKFKKIKINFNKKNDSSQIEKIKTVAPTATLPLNPQTNNLKAQIVEKKKEPLVSFSFALNSSYNIQAEKQSDGTRAEYLQHEINPLVKISDYTLQGFFYYYDDLKAPATNEWQDSFIALNKAPWNLGDYFTLAPGLALTLPLSKASREVVSSKYSVGASLALGLNTKNMGLDAFSVTYSLGYTKMYSDYETNIKNEPSTNYRIRQRLTLGYQITDALSFKTRFQYDSSYSYANVVRDAFLHFQVFEYQFTEHISANIGHANAGNSYLVKESENDYYLQNNVKFFDPETSEYSIGIGLSI